jgi:hypothetical protein
MPAWRLESRALSYGLESEEAPGAWGVFRSNPDNRA